MDKKKEINKCFCGKEAEVEELDHEDRNYLVRCTGWNCWAGAARALPSSAIRIWNIKTSIAKNNP